MSDTSNTNTNTNNSGGDTRPSWMLDPSITEVDEAAIASIGKDIEDNLQSSVVDNFLNRSTVGDGTSTVESASPDAAPVVEQPSSGAASDDGGTDSTVTPPPVELPQSFAVTVPGVAEPITIDQSQALALIQQHNWLHSQAPEVQQAWGSIAEGTHQAIPNQEYAAFEAWRKSGSPAAQSSRRFDLDDLPPEVAQHVQDLEARTSANGQSATSFTAPQLTPTQLMQQQQEAINRQVAIQSALDATRIQFAAEYSLDQTQLNALEQVIVQSQIVPQLNNRYRQTVGNMVVAEADPTVVMREAFEFGMSTDPRFRTIRDDHHFQLRLQREQAANSKVDGKKALASSLAHIPSAAVPSTSGKSLQQMTPQERSKTLNDQMVAELTELIASGEAIN